MVNGHPRTKQALLLKWRLEYGDEQPRSDWESWLP